ncbi:hypothetical protein [Granulicella sp. WH15]|nr:hypothetical protein [Granulicella sp. WH15]
MVPEEVEIADISLTITAKIPVEHREQIVLIGIKHPYIQMVCPA